MGVDCGDYDNDGRLDLFVTSFSNESPILFRNLGEGLFEDATNRAGAGSAFCACRLGGGFVDFDNDGDRDLCSSPVGTSMDNIQHIDTCYLVVKVPQYRLDERRPWEAFVDVSGQCGSRIGRRRKHSRPPSTTWTTTAMWTACSSTGECSANDPSQRVLSGANHRLQVAPPRTKSNRQGIGARVTGRRWRSRPSRRSCQRPRLSKPLWHRRSILAWACALHSIASRFAG